ncbi:MAG: Glu/Leu/Phe/Val dehydrogenase [Candidatus Melainabacteria bacterium]
MSYLSDIQERDHEGVLFCADQETGLKAFIAIHDTTLGPALGGCRMKAYANELEAFQDALNLSRAMTFKSSAAGLNLGGGKSVVMIDHPDQKTPELLKAFAERINLLNGKYIGAGDVGSNTRDLRIMRGHSNFVAGLATEDGGLGDSAILTSLGVFMGIRAAVKERLGREDLDGLIVGVQGAGKVGYYLVEHLVQHGCHVMVSDIDQPALDRVKDAFPSVQVYTASTEMLAKDMDIFSPNAVGGVITQDVAHGLKASIVAGGANNPLRDEKFATILQDRNILYAPDFVINAGGVIMISAEIDKIGFDAAKVKTEAIYDTTLRVFERAKRENILPMIAAQRIAMERIANAKKDRCGV